MELLSDFEANVWCGDSLSYNSAAVPSEALEFTSGKRRRIRITMEREPRDMVALAYMVLATASLDEDEFRGALIWLNRWEIGSESIDRAGYVFLNGIRSKGTDTPPVEIAPSHLFGSSEFPQAHATLSLPLLFQWDAHFVPHTKEFFVFISHEGYLDIVVENESAHLSFMSRFRQWRPKEISRT